MIPVFKYVDGLTCLSHINSLPPLICFGVCMAISLYDYSIKSLTGTATSFSFLYIVHTYSSVPDILNYIYYGTFKTYLIFFLDIFFKLLTTTE